MGAVALAPRRLCCPNCPTVALDVRRGEVRPGESAVRMHQCRGLAGMLAPLVPEGQRVKVEAVEREDYVGREVVTRDGDGRPIQAVVTTRDDGKDCAVFAPCAIGKREDVR